MMKRILVVATALLITIAVAITSCSKDGSESGYNRIILVYLAANNNLSNYASDNVSNLLKGYLPKENSNDVLLVYSHLMDHTPVLLRIYRDDNGVPQQDIVANYDNQNSTTPQVLNSVLKKIKIIFPAKEYGLILWSHGTGWLPQNYYDNPEMFGVFMPDPYSDIVKSFGFESGVEMDIKEMAASIPYHFSFIIFDCCLMGGVEVAYEVKNKCDYIIASPAEVLATGFPYDVIMEPLFRSKADLEEVCQRYFDFYDSQNGVYKSATIALYRSDKFDELAAVCKSIFATNREKLNSLQVTGIQRYFRLNKHWFYDIGDFISRIASQQELLQFNDALSKVVIKKLTTPTFLDFTINSYSGLSTYIQSNGSSFLDSYYKGYKWNIATEMVK
ncbi:MAG: hypothetical protein KBG04_08055 [Bacteroidales bacterium]|nr:hypothetical protein [Bacteroidales bacterium]